MPARHHPGLRVPVGPGSATVSPATAAPRFVFLMLYLLFSSRWGLFWSCPPARSPPTPDTGAHGGGTTTRMPGVPLPVPPWPPPHAPCTGTGWAPPFGTTLPGLGHQGSQPGAAAGDTPARVTPLMSPLPVPPPPCPCHPPPLAQVTSPRSVAPSSRHPIVPPPPAMPPPLHHPQSCHPPHVTPSPSTPPPHPVPPWHSPPAPWQEQSRPPPPSFSTTTFCTPPTPPTVA